jgi:hypothetical protein
MKSVLAPLLLAAAALAAPCVQAQTTALRVRGTISAVTDKDVTVQTQAGESVKVALAEKVTVLLYTPLKLADIKPDAYVAVASLPQPDGSLRAAGLVVFPESMRGMNEGTKGWDLAPGSRMTNASVARFVAQGGNREITLRYEGDKTQTVAVPETVPVTTFAPTERAALAVGAKSVVFATRTADGGLSSGMVGVGKDGLMPPI